MLSAHGTSIQSPSRKTPQFEVWSSALSTWQALLRDPGVAGKSKFKTLNPSVGGWGFSARVSSALTRSLDRVLHVRVRLENQWPEVSALAIS